MIPLLVFVGAYWLLITQTSLNRALLTAGYFVVLIIYVVVRSIMSQIKLTQLDLPADYRRMFAISQIISLLGIAWFVFTFVNSM